MFARAARSLAARPASLANVPASVVASSRAFSVTTSSSSLFTGKLACLDLEGVLIPEVWVNLADRVGVEALKRTTRDEPDYNKLMRYRLDIMNKEGLGMADINAAIESMEPLPGAVDMVAWLRERFQVVILSDTFYEVTCRGCSPSMFPTLSHSLAC